MLLITAGFTPSYRLTRSSAWELVITNNNEMAPRLKVDVYQRRSYFELLRPGAEGLRSLTRRAATHSPSSWFRSGKYYLRLARISQCPIRGAGRVLPSSGRLHRLPATGLLTPGCSQVVWWSKGPEGFRFERNRARSGGANLPSQAQHYSY